MVKLSSPLLQYRPKILLKLVPIFSKRRIDSSLRNQTSTRKSPTQSENGEGRGVW